MPNWMNRRELIEWREFIIEDELMSEKKREMEHPSNLQRFQTTTGEEHFNFREMCLIPLIVDPKDKPVIQDFIKKSLEIWIQIYQRDEKVTKQTIRKYIHNCEFSQCYDRFRWKIFQMLRVRGFV